MKHNPYISTQWKRHDIIRDYMPDIEHNPSPQLKQLIANYNPA
jgi:hypothetical protein